jgi:tetratricopeptide (TPR) repeat protein
MAEQNYGLAYLFARRAFEIPSPKGERLFVDKPMYNYERYLLLGKCAKHIGEYEIGEKALRKGLEITPNDKELSEELASYPSEKKRLMGEVAQKTGEFFDLYDTGINLEKRSTEGQSAWKNAVEYYLKAYSADPKHAEPLIRMAKRFMQQENYAMGYLFISRAMQLSEPSTVRSWEKDLYSYERYDIFATCAWYVGDYAGGEAALHKALAVKPKEQRLLDNLKIYSVKK